MDLERIGPKLRSSAAVVRAADNRFEQICGIRGIRGVFSCYNEKFICLGSHDFWYS